MTAMKEDAVRGTRQQAKEEEERRKAAEAPLWTTPQLSVFIKEVETLGESLATNLSRIREIDEEVHARKEALVGKSRSLLVEEAQQQQQQAGGEASGAGDNGGGSSKEELLAKQESISREFQELISRSEDKIHIAGQTYDLTDLHTCRLDKALKSLEEELRAKRRTAALYDPQFAPAEPVASSSHLGLAHAQGGGGRGRQAKRGLDGKLKGSSKKHQGMALQNPAGAGLGSSLVQQPFLVPVPDMQIDPSEPRYCYCSNVSFGEMVGCDNDECPWEWFHIGCVGILPHNMPKGKWYCPECRKNLKNKR
uniref:PHD finger protein ING n=1 Tax=Chloropicon laureae TaxID=464258 RepID=A0A7S2Z0C1_9CHLO|mmetsp:Transcript_13068/g.33795  ORF Transcript_13068/g.33795 Transcript_13068/m.33795 type:complete len:308 (+) Transcript_13068:1-924(+)